MITEGRERYADLSEVGLKAARFCAGLMEITTNKLLVGGGFAVWLGSQNARSATKRTVNFESEPSCPEGLIVAVPYRHFKAPWRDQVVAVLHDTASDEIVAAAITFLERKLSGEFDFEVGLVPARELYKIMELAANYLRWTPSGELVKVVIPVRVPAGWDKETGKPLFDAATAE